MLAARSGGGAAVDGGYAYQINFLHASQVALPTGQEASEYQLCRWSEFKFGEQNLGNKSARRTALPGWVVQSSSTCH